MDINVRLGGGGKNARQQKISAKSTHNSNKTTMQQSSNGNTTSTLKNVNKGVSTLTGFASGNAGALIGLTGGYMSVISMSFKGVDRMISFGSDIYKAITGEDMLASNIKAYSKTISQGGLNLVAGSISNYLFTVPRIRRENDMKDYGRELYLNSYEKNKLI